MQRGTTPTITVETNVNLGDYASLLLTLKQERKELNFTEKDVVIDGTKLYVYLTQQQTLGFQAGKKVRVGIKLKDTGGNVTASDGSATLEVQDILSGATI